MKNIGEAKRVLIAAGGTGGHFYPGLVLARALRQRGWQPLMVLKPGDKPAPDVPAATLELSGMPRRPGLELLRFPFKLARALRQADRLVRDFGPEAVVGMGGYLSFPVVAAAWRRGVPRAVHEANAVTGLANRACLRLGASLLPGVMPIREALWTRGDPKAARRELGLDPDKPTVLIFGGSQGARALNALELDAPQVLHLYGRGEAPKRATKALAYLDRMELAYAAADVVVCRSGASTLAELAAQRLPAVLVPFPFAADNHQEANARAAERAGAAVVVLEKELPKLGGLVKDLLSSEPERRAMSEAWSKLGLPEPSKAGQALADAVEKL